MFTQGRWVVSQEFKVDDPELPLQFVITSPRLDGSVRFVAVLSGTHHSVAAETEANARLMAAAPALLAAAKEALDEYEGNDCDEEYCPAMGLLRAAIRSAEGGAK